MEKSVRQLVEDLVLVLERMRPDGADIHNRVQVISILKGWLSLDPQSNDMEIDTVVERAKLLIRSSYGK
jgi:hypothetical protein